MQAPLSSDAKNGELSLRVAQALLDISAVGFVPDNPIRFKSGILSPVYLDNRRFPFHPVEWKKIIISFAELVRSQNIHFDVVAGVESAGIPHSAALSYELGCPSVFVRKQAKDHGTKKMVEGGDVRGKTVLLIEDHISTGMSSLAAIDSLRQEGAVVTHCLSISSYGFSVAVKNFAEKKVTLLSLVDFPTIVKAGVAGGKINAEQEKTVLEWMRDPEGWEKNR